MAGRRHRIDAVTKGSIAEEAGVEPGDYLISINNIMVNDIIEYRFLINDETIELIVQKPTGEEWVIEIDKEPSEDLGMVFADEMMDKAKRCRNKCVFCFIDQLPKGMRESLYFKDDDSRLSFLQGNFISLTNLTDDDADRIIRYRISPLNVSVHTTDPETRNRMLGNPRAGEALKLLERFAENGIILNCQIVLCPGINDRDCLDNTVSDLGILWPSVRSIGIVPVGLTKYREGLYPIDPCDDICSKGIIDKVRKWQNEFLTTKGSRLVFIADEFYLRAGEDIPPFEEYEDFPQLENGIGLMALFKRELEDELSAIRVKGEPKGAYSLATGNAACGFMRRMSSLIESEYKSIRIQVYPITNCFFGDTIDVSGLITGKDLIEQLRNKPLDNALLIPQNMLKSGSRVFLDDVTVEDVEKELGVKVIVCPVKGDEFVRKTVREDAV
ncbi:MAG: Fe-S oxidoreductase, related to NifB/MoaA family with PDZ N-terminal domain [Firmicutes bacterium]|nr:Fe-S oxidoreductase, related to NifB/MoaA family with PDZ N-terminal domain [Bacillota bacterium]